MQLAQSALAADLGAAVTLVSLAGLFGEQAQGAKRSFKNEAPPKAA